MTRAGLGQLSIDERAIWAAYADLHATARLWVEEATDRA